MPVTLHLYLGSCKVQSTVLCYTYASPAAQLVPISSLEAAFGGDVDLLAVPIQWQTK